MAATLLEPTPSNPTGPAYRKGAPFRQDLAPEGVRGTPLVLTGRVLHPDARPVEDAVLDLWHAGPWGLYDMFSREMRYRGRVRVEEDGSFRAETLVPRGYLWRPPHVHLKVWVGDRVALTSQLYLPGYRRLHIDPHVRERLVVDPEEREGGVYVDYDLVLAG